MAYTHSKIENLQVSDYWKTFQNSKKLSSIVGVIEEIKFIIFGFS